MENEVYYDPITGEEITPDFRVETVAIDWPLWILAAIAAAIVLSDLGKGRRS
ncbi:MAG: hypothetical protein WC329_04440 [Candidatus Omnitrophota bacterium]|jgi:hypothetical protein